MGTTIYRGSTPIIRFRPQNGVSVLSLGTPSVSIAQELVYLTPTVTVDSNTNSISVKLTEEESLQLVDGIPATVQEIWDDGHGNVVRFPTHELSVGKTIMESVDDTPTPQPVEALENCHPFFDVSPFTENGYWDRYLDTSAQNPEALVTQWAAATSPWTDHSTGGFMRFSSSDLNNFKVTPLNAASLDAGSEYYLWISVPTTTSVTTTLAITNGPGYCLEYVSASPSAAVTTSGVVATVTLNSSRKEVLLKMRALTDTIANPLFFANISLSTNTANRSIAMALYKIVTGRSESDYKQYISFYGG